MITITTSSSTRVKPRRPPPRSGGARSVVGWSVVSGLGFVIGPFVLVAGPVSAGDRSSVRNTRSAFRGSWPVSPMSAEFARYRSRRFTLTGRHPAHVFATALD